MNKPYIDEFKGQPILKLPLSPEGETKHFSFGLSKARLIAKFYKYIKSFVASEGKTLLEKQRNN